MTSVERRRSGRKSGKHRKHSNGSYSDTSSGGSFLDETDREVSNLTERAFRSLCIGDEAVYNDSDLCSSSPSTQTNRQQAFNQSDQDKEDREGEELKRAAHENFCFSVQQYGQDWIHGAKLHGDPQWGVHGDRGTQRLVSATFQHSFVERSPQEKSLKEGQLSFVTNGATDLSSQQRRSCSRVSSLIRAFNSEGYRDGAGMNSKFREWNDEASWDKSALMSIQRELSEFSTTYHQNFDSSAHPSTGPFSAKLCSSEVASAVAHMNCTSSLIKSPHCKHGAYTHVNCNSNFFIHSEFSPFKVWRGHNRLPFQQGEVSQFVHCSKFPKWYKTPIYKELSLQAQPQGSSIYEEWDVTPRRNTFVLLAPPAPPRSTSTSKLVQKAATLQKRSESELAGHYPHWKEKKSMGTNRLPSQRPSTVSPTLQMSHHIRDTLSSVSDLQEKLKIMASEQKSPKQVTVNQQGVFHNNDFITFGNTAATIAHNFVSSNIISTPFTITQLVTPTMHAQEEAETSELQQYAVSVQVVEHPPVQAESRGATPDGRMSNYKSRTTSLLFNLKDNSKRVKSTYSPTKFKGLETVVKNKQPSYQDVQKPEDTVIVIPDIHFSQAEEETSRIDSESHQYEMNHFHNPGTSALTFQPTALTGANSEYTSKDYLSAQMYSQMVHHSGLTGLIPEKHTSHQLAKRQNIPEDLSPFAPYKQSMVAKIDTTAGNFYRQRNSNNPGPLLKPKLNLTPSTGMSIPNVENSSTKTEFLFTKTNDKQYFNESAGREFTKFDRCSQLKENKHYCSNVSSQDKLRQQVCLSSTSIPDTEKYGLKEHFFPAETKHAQSYQRETVYKEEVISPKHNYQEDNPHNISKQLQNIELGESLAKGASSNKKAGFDSSYHIMVSANISNEQGQYAPLSKDSVGKENPAYGKQQSETLNDNYTLQNYNGKKEKNELKDNYLTQNHIRSTNQEYRKQHTFHSNEDKITLNTPEPAHRKQFVPNIKENEVLILQKTTDKQQFEKYLRKNSLCNPDKPSALMKDGQYAVVKAEQGMKEQIESQQTQAEMAKPLHWAQVETPKAESAAPKLNIAGHACTEKIKTELAKGDKVNHEKAERENFEEATADIKSAQVRHEQRTQEWTEESKGKWQEQDREEETQVEQTSTQKVTIEPKHIIEKGGEADHIRGEQMEQVKSEQDEVKRMKEEHIKPELAKTQEADQGRAELVRGEQSSTDRTGAEQQGEWIRAEKVEVKWLQAEQHRTEMTKAVQADAEHTKTEKTKLEQASEVQQIKAEQEKRTLLKEGNLKFDNIKVKDVREETSGAGHINTEQSRTEPSKAAEKAEEGTAEKMPGTSAKSTAIVAVTEQVKCEPDKVEQVKTELAKAKAELAKIKEKMRGEQKKTVRNIDLTKEDEITKKVVPLRVNISKNEECKESDQATQMHHEKGDSIVNGHSRAQADKGPDDYERLREKYGFTNTLSTNRSKMSTARDDSETALALDRAEPRNNKTSKAEHSPISMAKTENMEGAESTESNEVKDSHYVYSESSKEFKLSKTMNCDTVTGKVKDDKVKNKNVEKCDPVKNNTDNSLPLERKPKPNEHGVVPGKDTSFTPLRPLSHKDRFQTKQEKLTSKIKAHAEKEISAIKEKGFAIRDGIITSKNSIKQLAGSHSINVRQKPPSQEASRKPDSTISNIITPHHSQKQVQKEAVIEAKLTKGSAAGIDEALTERAKNKHSGNKLPAHNKEEAPNIKEKQEDNQGENTGKPKQGLITHQPNEKKVDPSQTRALVKTERSKLDTAGKAKHQPIQNYSEPSLKTVIGQNETSVVDDNLKIMGIMITVRERNISLSKGQGDQNTEAETKGDVSHSENMQDYNKYRINQKRTIAQQESCTVNERPQRETRLQESVADKNKSSALTVPAKNKISAETPPLLHKQEIITRDSKDNTNKTPKESRAKSNMNNQVKANAKEKTPEKTQTANINEMSVARSTNTINNQDYSSRSDPLLQKPVIQPSVKDTITVTNPSKGSNKDVESAPLLEERRHNFTSPEMKPNKKGSLTGNGVRHESMASQYTGTHSGENNQVGDNVYVESIAIQVVTGTNEENNPDMMRKDNVITTPTSVSADSQNKDSASSSLDGKVKTLNNDDLARHRPPTKRKLKQMKDENLEAQFMANVEQRVHSLQNSHQHNSVNAGRDDTQAKNGQPERVNKMAETMRQPTDDNYFQLQGEMETNNDEYSNKAKVGEKTDPQVKDLSCLLPNQANISKESHKEHSKNEVLLLEQTTNRTMESSSVIVINDNVKKTKREREDKMIPQQNGGPTERLSNTIENEVSPAIHIAKVQSSLSVKERQSFRNSHSTRGNAAEENLDQVRPKSKQRMSAIPEISAIADYARLKVIVLEEQPKTPQEFPPSKKDGFFPIIQTHHSRCPVFATDPQELCVKEKSLRNNSEVSTKVNKEAKSLVFPIMEKEHQRTGMFKLGGKGRQEELLPVLKGNESISDNGPWHAQDFKDRNNLQTRGEHMPAAITENKNIHQPNDAPTMQAPTSSSSINNKPRNASLLQLHPTDSFTQDATPKQFSPKAEGIAYFDRNSLPPPTMGQRYNMEENTTTLGKDEKIEKQRDKDQGVKTADRRTEKLRQERLESQHEEIKAILKTAEQGRRPNQQEKGAAITEEEKGARQRAEVMQIEQIIEDSTCRASLAEEEKGITRREEERRAREREAIAVKIKERQEKKRRAQGEIKDREALKEEENRAKQREVIRRINEFEEETAIKVRGEESKEIEKYRRGKVRGAVERVGEQRRTVKQLEGEWGAEKQEEKPAQIRTTESSKEEQRKLGGNEEWIVARNKEDWREVEQIKSKQEQHDKEMKDTTRLLEGLDAAQGEREEREAQEWMLVQRKGEISAKQKEEQMLAQRQEERASQREEQRRIDALQYYAITTTESERKARVRHLYSPLPPQQRNNGQDSTEDAGAYSRPHAPRSPAPPPAPPPPLPRSNTSSPALGAKPAMFRVKDNTMRGSSFIKSIRPRFHKNFGADLRMCSLMENWRVLERKEDEQERMSHSAGTPVHLDVASASNILSADEESFTHQPASPSQGNSAPNPQHRPLSRRSIALDEDDSHSVISYMSEDVESFATSAADMTDFKSLHGYERPESACSFNSDIARYLGKPPAVPPKSEKALRRAKRLNTRRTKKELSKAAADIPTAPSIPTPPSDHHPVLASPHFSSPVSLNYAPKSRTSLSSSNAEPQSSHHSFHASPHAAGPVSLPLSSTQAHVPPSLPVAPETVPSFPSLNHPASVTRYHVESTYGRSFPLTQRKVMQDVSSGQYFVMDMHVQVKTKTFFDPETGKYVQLNVRESAQSGSQPQSQPAYSRPQFPAQMQVNQLPMSHASPVGKPLMLYQGYHSYPQSHHPMPTSSIPPQRSTSGMSVLASLSQDQEPVKESHIYGYQANEVGQNSNRQNYSTEQAPYMDTANDTNKTCNLNTVCNTHGSFESCSECDTNSQLAVSSLYECDNSAHPRYQPRDIITMGELEDFMDVSDW